MVPANISNVKLIYSTKSLNIHENYIILAKNGEHLKCQIKSSISM